MKREVFDWFADMTLFALLGMIVGIAIGGKI